MEFFDTIMYAEPSSRSLEDNLLHKVVVCVNNVHQTISIYGVDGEDAKENAENFMLKIIKDEYSEVVETWDKYDIEHGEPGNSWYPDNHRNCTTEK